MAIRQGEKVLGIANTGASALVFRRGKTCEVLELAKEPIRGTCATVVSGLDSQSVIVRHVQLPLKRKKDVICALEFQMEEMIPYAEDEAITILQMEKVGSGNCYTVAKDQLSAHMHAMRARGIDPDAVSCPAHALLSFSLAFASIEGPAVLFHFGDCSTQLVLVEGQQILANHEIDIGLCHFFDALAVKEPTIIQLKEQMRLLGIMSAARIKLYDVLGSYHKRIKRTFEAFEKSYGAPLQQVCYSGHVEVIEYLEALMENQARQKIALNAPESSIVAAIEIGLALSDLNMCIEEFAPVHALQKQKKGCRRFAIASAMAICALMLISEATLYMHRRFVHKSIESLYEQDFVRSMMQRDKALPSSEEELMQIQVALDRERLLGNLLSEPFYCSDLIDQLQKKCKGTIRAIQYDLTSAPSLKTLKAPYAAKVLLQISAENEKIALADVATLKEDRMISDVGKIKYRQSDKTYEVEFLYTHARPVATKSVSAKK